MFFPCPETELLLRRSKNEKELIDNRKSKPIRKQEKRKKKQPIRNSSDTTNPVRMGIF